MQNRAGAHANKRTPDSRTLRRACHAGLCLLLAVLLAVFPLTGAYGLDAGDAQPPSVGDAATIIEGDVPVDSQGDMSDSPDGDVQDEAPADAPDGEGAVVDDATDAEVAELASDAPDADPESAATGVPVETEAAADEVAEGEPAAQPVAVPATTQPSPDAGVTAIQPAQSEEAANQSTPAQRASGSSATSPVATGSPANYQPVLEPVSGAISLLVIVAGFTGINGAGAVATDDSYDWNDAIFGSRDGVSAYYNDMSGGAFTFTPAAESSAYGTDGNTNKADAANDGIVHVTLPEAHGNWQDTYYTDAKVAGAMLATFSRILAAADAYVDFASYDTDANGKLDTSELAIAFVIAGYEEALGSGDLPQGAYSLWAHAWSYDDAGLPRPELDGISLNDYIAISEKLRDTSGSKPKDIQEPVSVLIHELGHYLGLPDLYATGSDDGEWLEHSVSTTSLMADGEWATVGASDGGSTYTPTALDAWSRYQLGWVEPTVVKKGGVYTVSAQGSKNGYSVLLIPTKNKGEYYLIENRTFSGHDAGLASDYDDYSNGGLIIWHIDNGVVTRYLASNQVNAGPHRPGVIPLYPEEDDYSWGYSLKYRASEPDANYPFWTKDLFKKLFPSETYLNLPLYGKGKKADRPTARTLSGIRIEFLTGSGADMRIRIIMPGEEEPESQPEEKPQKSVAAQAALAAPAPDAPRIPDTGDDLPFGAALAMLLSAAVAVYARHQAQAIRPKHARKYM